MKHRHPGVGRDPECSMVRVFLGSGLRPKEVPLGRAGMKELLKFVLSKCHSSQRATSPPAWKRDSANPFFVSLFCWFICLL
jgi:hypothetical protein